MSSPRLQLAADWHGGGFDAHGKHTVGDDDGRAGPGQSAPAIDTAADDNPEGPNAGAWGSPAKHEQDPAVAFTWGYGRQEEPWCHLNRMRVLFQREDDRAGSMRNAQLNFHWSRPARY